MTNLFTRSTLAAAVIAAFLPAGAAAQQAAPAPITLPAVVVTDTSEQGSVTAKQATVGVLGDLPLIQTPFSVNVITQEVIQKQQAAFVGDVLKNDPSATVGNVAVPFLLLRGFSVGSDGTLYDGMPGNGGLSDGRMGMALIDRVEVLKGASAFLYGVGSATSLGGTINYIPKRPDVGHIRDIGFGYGNNSLFNVTADIGDRFGEGGQFGYRVNVGWRDGEQSVDRYEWQQDAVALALDWRVQPGLLFNFGYDHIANHIPTLPPFYVLAPGLAVPEAPDASRSAALSWDDFRTTSDNYTGRVDWDFAPDWSMTAQALHNVSGRPGTNQARFGMILNAQGDAELFSGKEVSWNRTDSAQVLVHGKFETGSLKHKPTIGLSAYHQDVFGGYMPGVGPGPFGGFPTNIYNPVVNQPEPASPAPDRTHNSRIESKSLMLSDIVSFNEQWSVLLGAREADMSVVNYGAVTSTDSITKTLPTAALMYKPTAASLIYLNYAEGLEQGGSATVIPGGPSLPPQLTNQIELGAKLEHANMTYTVALFSMERPLVIPASPTPPPGTPAQERGEQQHRGIEFVVNGRITPQLTIVSGLMLLDTELSDTGDPLTEGKQAIGVPKFNANLWGEYRIVEVPGLALNAGVYHSGSQYLDGANTQSIPSWTRFDIGASYATRVGGVPSTFLLTIENVADKNYWASAQGGILTMADPMTVKLGARLSF